MEKIGPNKKNVFILGMGSDIAKELARCYLQDGHYVAGAYRRESSVADILSRQDIDLFKCDVSKRSSVKKCLDKYKRLGRPWDIFISCVGSMEPIGKFFDCDFDDWQESLTVNSLSQLRFLRGIHPLRRKKGCCHVVFFAGGGTNNPFANYSAYCVSKIMLIKMCELLDDENKDLNVFIIGPGWVRTKIHEQTLKSRSRAGNSYDRTLKFLRSNCPGTNYRKIYDCIDWCVRQGPEVSGGRNFSVVHDPWRDRPATLARQLCADPDKFKLRRFKGR